MESVKFDKERGQILVQVALMVVALFAFVALALDVGHVYAGRRRMQNAADAGSLAGAHAICFPDQENPVDPEEAAREYAERNGAEAEDLEVMIVDEDHTVVVTAGQTLDTFFAGVIGINTANVRAEAAARCSSLSAAGGLWPVAFDLDVYTESIPCNDWFYVLTSKDGDGLDCAPECCICADKDVVEDSGCDWEDDCAGKCDCSTIGPHLRTSDRGWLLFPKPTEGRPDACKGGGASDPCGEPTLACWLAENHPGPIKVGDCIPGKAGLTAANDVIDAIDYRAEEQDVLRIILFDRECGEEGDPDPLGSCGTGQGTIIYHVADFGCIQVLEYISPNAKKEDAFFISSCGDPGQNCLSQSDKLHVIKAFRICDEGEEQYRELYRQYCSSTSGQSGTELPENWQLRGVSLIQWPPPADE